MPPIKDRDQTDCVTILANTLYTPPPIRALTYDLDSQSMAHYDDDPHTRKVKVKGQAVQKLE